MTDRGQNKMMSRKKTQADPAETASSPIVSEQYARQILMWGDDGQKRITDTGVIIVGWNTVSRMLSACLLGLGIGRLYIFADELNRQKGSSKAKNFLEAQTGKEAKGLERLLQTINPSVEIGVFASQFTRSIASYCKADFMIDARDVKDMGCISYALRNDVRLFDIKQNQHGTGFRIDDTASLKNKLDSLFSAYDNDMTKKNRKKTASSTDAYEILGIASSGIIAGLISDEIRKSRVKITPEALSDKEMEHGSGIRYDIQELLQSGRLNPDADSNNPAGTTESMLVERLKSEQKKNRKKQSKKYSLSRTKVLIVGAGAIGNYVALNTALMGFGHIDIMDDDVAEASNLNRQILLYGGIGKNKAKTLTERIKQINPEIKSTAFDKKLVKKNSNIVSKYDLVFSCVDNLDTRYDLSNACLKNSIPLVDGGTNEKAGVLYVFVPGKTSCISCQRGLESKLKAREKLKNTRASCGMGEASVVVPNIIIGSLMAAAGATVMNRDYDAMPNGSLNYECTSDKDYKFNMFETGSMCKCSEKYAKKSRKTKSPSKAAKKR